MVNNFIGNAVKFANKNILLSIVSDNINLYILIEDDAQVFLRILLKPWRTLYKIYIVKSYKKNAGLGLEL